ncbi:MAG: hypothetical protein COY81_02655 [Candidatus Pacebacteria bacterium CG_4_10_14_0_8_um_filter_43_12]|nr:MAG: hypothetical protein COU66_00905 [Candidatus Pacebacteria bacterium CG10_big_fil_rev_8_21_14_0_10_44_11]PIY79442.1 MAG: hypothetical protein COY81_02655 [Candidatus Pacebacteria bacterium CG_4_10_14_0_8_um_filter_43_12]
MSDQTILCPNCHHPIPLTDALTGQLTEHIKADLELSLAAQKSALQKEKTALEEQKKQQAELVQKLIDQEKKKIWAVAQQKAKENQSKELQILQEQLQEKEKKLAESDKLELELRKQKRQVEEQAKRQELELARKLDSEREKITQEAKKQEAETQQQKIAEQAKQMAILKKTIEDLRRQSEQGSMQIQGEVAENSLKDRLANTFPMDDITDVPTGITGADLVQAVNAKIGASLATILWESKNTKVFSDGWLTKLKRDQQAIKADVAILVTKELPKTITNFGQLNGIWVTAPDFVVPLATTLRLHLTQLEKVKRSLEGRDEKITMLYNYLTGNEFRNHVENMVLAFVEMQKDLDSEKNAFRRLWSKREKQIERLLISTSGMYGDFQGIVGGALPTIQQLELDQPEVEVTVSLTSGNLFD